MSEWHESDQGGPGGQRGIHKDLPGRHPFRVALALAAAATAALVCKERQEAGVS